MRSLGIREFRLRMSEELKKLPFVLTRNGEQIAWVLSPGKSHAPDPVDDVKSDIKKVVAKESKSSGKSAGFFNPQPKLKDRK